MIKKCLALSILVALLVPVAACNGSANNELAGISLVLTHGIVIDGKGSDPIPDGLVAIRDNRIVFVGQSSEFRIPRDALVIDAEGGTILPGVINSHARNVAGAGTRRISFLLDGVTSVCDLGAQLMRMPAFEEEKVNSGPAARGFKAGPIITAPGGYPAPFVGSSISYEVQGKDEAELAVHDLHTQGADFIKVALDPGTVSEPWPVLNLEELRTVVETAHSYGLLVRAHMTDSTMLDMALEAGVDVIEHVPMPPNSHVDLESMFDDSGNFRMPPELETQMLRMIEQRVVLVPTLDVYMGDIEYFGDRYGDADSFMEALLGVVRFFHDSGGTIALGNDYSNPGVESEMPLSEMILLRSAGLTPSEVIKAATRQAAYVCGQGNELGTLEAGKLADIIVVEGNPLDDLNAMDSILYVVKDGDIVVSPVARTFLNEGRETTR
jgi:imidazolonepropionase-like amidohydrolase